MEPKELFSKVKQDVGSILGKVARKTEFVAKLSKLKLDIANINGKIKSSYKKMGEYVYTNKEQFDDEFLSDLVEKIDELNENIKKIEASIKEIKEAEKELHKVPKEEKEDAEKEEKA